MSAKTYLYTSTRKQEICELSKRIESLKKEVKREHYERLLDKHQEDGKRVWEILREVSRTKEVPDDKQPSNLDSQKANTFNQYFATVGKRALETLEIHI